MLVECGLLRVELGDERSCTFRPSLGRIGALASPEGLVELFGRLHGQRAEAAACEILAGLCDPDDCHALPDLIGEAAAATAGVEWVGGMMPGPERVILARHLMLHGMVGKARPDSTEPAKRGAYTPRFDADEYIAAAEVHLGMSRADAAALSMTEFQRRFEMKFPPEHAPGAVNVPSREEYEAGMRAFRELQERRAQGVADHG